MSGPLTGVKVIDISMLLPGPLCSMHLADMGAEVIKVENPRMPDMTRLMGSKLKKGESEESGFFLILNRNKKSVTINIKRPEGREVLLKLLEDADILLEGFRPQTMAEMGIGYEQLKTKFPRLIYCAISGYGTGGPSENLAGHDANYIARSGLLDITGKKEGPPVLPGFQVADIAGGSLTALSSILAALYAREKTGKGQFLDISMMDGAFSLLSLHAGEYIASGQNPERGAMPLSGGLANYNVYRCRDGKYVMLGALEERFFKSFLRRIEREDLMEYFTTDEEMQVHLKSELQNIFGLKDRDEWDDLFLDPDSCLSPVNSIEEAFEDPQLKARDMIVTMVDHELGEVSLIGSPFRFSDSRPSYRYFPPKHGQHTDEILQELGFDKATIEELRKKRAV